MLSNASNTEKIYELLCERKQMNQNPIKIKTNKLNKYISVNRNVELKFNS